MFAEREEQLYPSKPGRALRLPCIGRQPLPSVFAEHPVMWAALKASKGESPSKDTEAVRDSAREAWLDYYLDTGSYDEARRLGWDGDEKAHRQRAKTRAMSRTDDDKLKAAKHIQDKVRLKKENAKLLAERDEASRKLWVSYFLKNGELEKARELGWDETETAAEESALKLQCMFRNHRAFMRLKEAKADARVAEELSVICWPVRRSSQETVIELLQTATDRLASEMPGVTAFVTALPSPASAILPGAGRSSSSALSAAAPRLSRSSSRPAAEHNPNSAMLLVVMSYPAHMPKRPDAAVEREDKRPKSLRGPKSLSITTADDDSASSKPEPSKDAVQLKGLNSAEVLRRRIENAMKEEERPRDICRRTMQVWMGPHSTGAPIVDRIGKSVFRTDTAQHAQAVKLAEQQKKAGGGSQGDIKEPTQQQPPAPFGHVHVVAYPAPVPTLSTIGGSGLSGSERDRWQARCHALLEQLRQVCAPARTTNTNTIPASHPNPSPTPPHPHPTPTTHHPPPPHPTPTHPLTPLSTGHRSRGSRGFVRYRSLARASPLPLPRGRPHRARPRPRSHAPARPSPGVAAEAPLLRGLLRLTARPPFAAAKSLRWAPPRGSCSSCSASSMANRARPSSRQRVPGAGSSPVSRPGCSRRSGR